MKKLDRIDRKILDELQKNARISYVELGERVGLSTSPCLERVRRLEQGKYIVGYTAILNPARGRADGLCRDKARVRKSTDL